MSFLTEYFDEFRQHPIRKTKMCRPENRWAKLDGNWLDPKVGTQDNDIKKQTVEGQLSLISKEMILRCQLAKVGTGDDIAAKAWTEEEIEAFIKATMKSLRGQSTYYNEYCAHLSPEFKTRPFKPREKKRRPCVAKDEKVVTEEEPLPDAPKLAMKDTELMKVAAELYERDMDKPTLEPLPTHFRILGYARPCLFKTGISDYQESIARLAYELIRDDRIPRYHAHNGCRPRWGLPPEGTRQPELDGAPYEGERLY